MARCKINDIPDHRKDPSRPLDLQKLVEIYLADMRPDEKYPDMGERTIQEWHDVYLSSLGNITDFICGEINETKAPHGSKYILNGHQWSFGFPERQHIVNLMAEKLSSIDKLDFDSFEDLIGYVQFQKEKYFGDTAIYDFALRYGWDKGIRPEVYVYIHAKPWEAAQHLVDEGYLSEIEKLERRLPLEKYKELLLPGMKAHDVEHFLCVFHDEIKKL